MVTWGLVAICSEDGNEFLGSIKGREFIDKLNDYQLFKKNVYHGVESYDF
jgi:hypothetical protein